MGRERFQRWYVFKFMALTGLIAGAGFIGIMKSAEFKERTKLLEDFLQMMLGIKSHINYLRQPLSTISGWQGSECRSKAFEMFDIIRTELCDKNAEIGEIWAQKVDEIYGDSPLDKEDRELLKYPGTFIGQTDYENQKARFEYFEMRLKEKIEAARTDGDIKGSLYKKIGFFAGILAAIIFI